MMAGICCGRGEAFMLLQDRIHFGIRVDVAQEMLEIGRTTIPAAHCKFVQGDATRLPLGDAAFDNVVILGGIHHVNDRQRLFSEVHRILKPGGKFYWREPVSDLFLWRWLRRVIYSLSPKLDADTERPLRYAETKQHLEQAGFRLLQWNTHGFVGFMLFMNTDVLVFNRLFRFIPGIRAITRWFARFDDRITRLPGMKHFGLQVIGAAMKAPTEPQVNA
jgi:SAM-dependent methyltransferase